MKNVLAEWRPQIKNLLKWCHRMPPYIYIYHEVTYRHQVLIKKRWLVFWKFTFYQPHEQSNLERGVYIQSLLPCWTVSQRWPLLVLQERHHTKMRNLTNLYGSLHCRPCPRLPPFLCTEVATPGWRNKKCTIIRYPSTLVPKW